MKRMGSKMLTAMFANKLRFNMLSSFNELDTAFWKDCSEHPSLVVFNLAYFFPSVNAQFAQHLARLITDIMEKYPLNKYVLIVQQSTTDNGINSYRVFRRLIERAPFTKTIMGE